MNHVRHLQIMVDYPPFDRVSVDREMVLMDTVSRLKPLACWKGVVPSDCKVEFTIRSRLSYESSFTDGYDDQNMHLANFLESVREAVYNLKHDTGAKVTVLHFGKVPGSRVHKRWNLTALFSLSKAQWEYVRSNLIPHDFHSLEKY
jgi:hypothetical protein